MKKIYLLFSLLAFTLLLTGQTLLTEDFSAGVMPPDGWSIDAHADNWSTETSENAGGTAPEAKFNWDPDFIGDSRFISPVIDLTGQFAVALSFRMMVDDYSGNGYSVGVATTSQGGDWTIAWEISPGGDIEAEEFIIQIINSDVGQADFQFCIYFSGNSYNLDGWFIDDIRLFLPYNLDGAMSFITTDPYLPEAAPVEGVVTNMGYNQITSLEVNWQVDGGDIHTTAIDELALDFSDTYAFTCDDLFDFPMGTYALDVWIETVNGAIDHNPDNDLLTKMISIVSNMVDKKPCFEEFTSSTCAPCATLNSGFNPWLDDHADDITLIKYQMDWPAPGDPYYTEEGGDRRGYYGVSYVPWVNLNGFIVPSDVGDIDDAFNEAMLEAGYLSIISTHSLEGTTMTVEATVLPYADFSDYVVHIVVFENMTTLNTGNNGETEFHHVMMKMMPDAFGTTLSMTDRSPVTITETADLSGTFVEEWDDLGVAIIVQNHTTKDVFQSAYSNEDAVFNIEARLSDLTYNGMQVPGFDPDIFEYYIELTPGREVPLVEGVAQDPNAIVVVEPAPGVPGSTTIDVFAEDLMTTDQYVIHWTGFTGLDEPSLASVTVYPNPSQGMVYVTGAGNGRIQVYNATGRLVIEENEMVNNNIDISAFPSGVYFLKVTLEDSSVVTRKITLY